MARSILQLPAIGSPEDLLAFLRDALNWPLSEDAFIDDATFDWTSDELRLPETASERLAGGSIRQLRPLVHSQPWGIFFVEFADPQIYRTALRQVLRGLVPNRRRDSSLQAWKHDNILFICWTGGFERITFAHFRGDASHRSKLSTFGWEKGSSYLRTLLEHSLPKLQWPEDTAAHEAWLKEWATAFDKEPLTKDFFKRFQEALERIKGDLQKYQKLNSAKAYSRAQLLLERLLFLYFLQNRGWLDQTRDYLLANFKGHADKPSQFSYYGEFLETLFWTLASAPGSSNRITGIPFLNGGLFDDDEFAQTDVRMKNHPPLRVRNDTFAFVFEHLLEAFNFTVREDTPLNQDVAVDPEMLGKVFESIVLHAEAADPDAVAPDKRKATGSYYTPRIVVHFICRESLCQYLVGHLPANKDWNRRIRELAEIFALDGLDADELTQIKQLLKPDEGRMLWDMIANLKCLDPSVGSGAFPVGLLQELLNLRRIFESAANGYVDPGRGQGNQWVHNTKAQIVENCLYGVDIQQQAIEICRLRLWLSLVVDYDIGVDPFVADRSQFRDSIKRISQLPNLEMNFRRGDSLLDMISNLPIRVDAGLLEKHRELVNKVKDLGHRLHKARTAESKKNFRLKILAQRLDLAEGVLQNEIINLDGEDRSIDSTLFGDLTTSERNRRKQIACELLQIKDALEQVQSDRLSLDGLAANVDSSDFYPRLRRLEGADFDSPFNFVWQIDFAEIFAPQTGKRQGGFDLIVGNPPFVTARNPVKRELYRERWKRVCHGKYLLICPFFELSFGLLRPDGELGFIVSNAFAKREFGKQLIECFFPTVDLQKTIDCSGLMFPGHGTPTCIIFGAQRRAQDSVPIRVAATLPGGGDLRTPPEESPLWATLELRHNQPGYCDPRVVVADRARRDIARWPWNFDSSTESTRASMEGELAPLAEFIDRDVGVCTMTNCDEIFPMTPSQARRFNIPKELLRVFQEGDAIRNWTLDSDWLVLTPYDARTQPLSEAKLGKALDYLRPYKKPLEDRLTFGSKSFNELGRPWFSFERMNSNKYSTAQFIAFVEIATHCHFVFWEEQRVYKQTCQTVKLSAHTERVAFDLLVGLFNSSAALFWLKQVCFSKRESEEGSKDTYFVFAGGKVQQLPVPSSIEDLLRGKRNPLASRLAALSRSCWENGRELPSLKLSKLFEWSNEAYQTWNAALPGYITPHPKCGGSFKESADLRTQVTLACSIRDVVRGQMIALQEEMDWLVYAAYGLLDESSAAVGAPWIDAVFANLNYKTAVPQLHEDERPFRFWSATEGDFDRAVALIPSDWPAGRRTLWEARLAAIRDNEHIRRIEAPVYKRRWDEQWKVGSRWLAGPVAYAQELVDAFQWWLAEKAEWHLEHNAKGGPLALDAWTIALWQDTRIQASWPVVADAIAEVARWKVETGGKAPKKPIQVDPSAAAFAKFLKDTINSETVPDGIPPAVPWDELEKKMKIPKQAQKVRGKLNVPRERFRVRPDGAYLWAGKPAPRE